MDLRKIPESVVVLTAAVLLAIWPLPDTIALRHLMLLSGSIAASLILTEHRRRLLSKNAWPIYVLFGFFLWLIFHLLVLAGNFQEQLHELTGDWLRNFLAASIGLALGIVLSSPTSSLSPRMQRLRQPLLICGLAGTVIIFCTRYAYEVVLTGQWIHLDFYMTPYLGKTALVIFGSLFLPVVFIKILSARQKTAPQIWYLYGLLGLVATIFTYYFANTKNGFAILVVLFGCFLIRVFTRSAHNQSYRAGFYALPLLCLLVFTYGVKKHLDSNPAWANLIADYKISVQIDQHNNWKDNIAPLPINERGIVVNGSTYQRVSWATAGLELLEEHPFGYGQINHSFGAMAIQKWGDFHKPDGNNRGATHSGWLDFGLGFGIPGLLLIWIPLAVSYRRALKHSDFWNKYAAWTIPVIAFSYVITEVCTSHFIELLFFLTALFSGLTLPPESETSGVHVDSA